MGTRGTMTIKDEEGKVILSMYRQFDSYFDGHGREVVDFIKNGKLVNGFGMDAKFGDTFNGMGASILDKFGAFGIIFGVLIIIFGHLMNISLNIMSGAIHGLRLNFIEWYHYSFEGDGKLFDPLRLLK